MRKSSSILAVLLVGLFGPRFAAASTCNGVSAIANLVQNCSFQTGDFTGWTGTTTTDPLNAFYANGVDQGDPLAVAGSQTPYGGQPDEAFLGSNGYTDTLTQTLTTEAGDYYQIEFALLNDTPAYYANSFVSTFGGATLLSETNAPVDGYTLYTYDDFATSDSTALSFTSMNGAGDFELDSISVEAVPTPEPSSIVLVATGVVGLAGFARRRMKA